MIEACNPTVNERLHHIIDLLYDAFHYAIDVDGDPWDFAIDVECLRDAGATRSDLRWLASKQYIDVARESREDGSSRVIRESEVSFGRNTVCVLTELGAQLIDGRDHSPADLAQPTPPNDVIPVWNKRRHELTWNGHLVKRFRVPAKNQEQILDVFEEDGWPPRVDDPLPPRAELNGKRRLHDTIHSLDRRQQHTILHFYGDGTGEGIRWRVIDRIALPDPPGLNV